MPLLLIVCGDNDDGRSNERCRCSYSDWRLSDKICKIYRRSGKDSKYRKGLAENNRETANKCDLKINVKNAKFIKMANEKWQKE